MNRAYKFKLYPTQEQEQQLTELVGVSRWIWNYMLTKNKERYEEEKKFVFKFEMSKLLPEIKKEYPWVSQLPSQALQQRCNDLDVAIQRVWKQGNGFPKYKSKNKEHHNTFRIPNQSRSIKLTTNQIKLPKLGWIKWHKHRNIDGELKNVTIKRENNQWWCVCLCELPDKIISNDILESDVVGIDLGIKDFAVMSNGEVIPSNNFYRKAEWKLKRTQRKLSKKIKGSKNYQKQKQKLNKQHYRVKCQRHNFTHQSSSMIAKYYKLVCLEDLNVSGMIKNRKLSKSISDQGWTQFVNQLAYKVDHLVKIDRFAASSKTFSSCGNKQDMPLDKRVYNCVSCKLEIDRDMNAAINIHNWGMDKIIGQGTVRIYACGDTSNGEVAYDTSSYVSLNQENNLSLERKHSVL